MPSSISNSEFQRTIPVQPWSKLLLIAAVAIGLATVGWEMRARAKGYAPTLNDNSDLWAERRKAVLPDSIVIIGDSRPLFDLDLDALEQGFGKRPIQLALAGTCCYPILENLANDPKFHGTIICSIVPAMYLVPGGPLLENSNAALKRYQNQTVAQRVSQQLGMFLEERIAFLKEDDLTLGQLVKQISIPNRAGAQLPPLLPPYFATMDRDRRARMTEACSQPGPLQDRIKYGWIPLFTPPPFPDYTPKALFEMMAATTESRFGNTAKLVKQLRDRGGDVVFVRFPMNGKLKELEEKATPRAGPWTRLVKEANVKGIYFEDYPELSSFECPEWSHLSASDSVEFTKRLVPHLRQAFGLPATQVTANP